MKEIVHQGLAKIVLQSGHVHLDTIQARKIIKESIEPDRSKKKELKEGTRAKISIFYDWWKEHSLLAKEFAIIRLKEARDAFRTKNSAWTQFLGNSFHFITDRATPDHSPDKIPPLFNSIHNDYEEGANGFKASSTFTKFFWGFVNSVANIGKNIIDLKLSHDNFEDLCEDKWDKCKNKISEIFLALKKPDKSTINLEMIEEYLDSLHEQYKNISLEWINTGNNYEKYMVKIAFVMYLAYQYTFKR